MSNTLHITPRSDKKEVYLELAPQLESLISDEHNVVANLANAAAVLREVFGWFWVGFYMADASEQLVLGPFQGPMACTRIKKGRGVCGTAWEKAISIVVPDVEKFKGHIACSSLSKSEIVVPIFVRGEVVGVLDVDSDELDTFDDCDREGLERLCVIIGKMIERCEK